MKTDDHNRISQIPLSVFYSPMKLDPVTVKYWRSASRANLFMTLALLSCFVTFPLGLTYLPLVIAILIRVSRMYDRALAEWIPNVGKEGLVRTRGVIPVGARNAAHKLYYALKLRKSVKSLWYFETRDFDIVTALSISAFESLGMTKLYFFVQPCGREECILHARAYKRFLTPEENASQKRTDQATRSMIADVYDVLGAGELVVGSPRQTGSQHDVNAASSAFSASNLRKRDESYETAINRTIMMMHASIWKKAFVWWFLGMLVIGVVLLGLYVYLKAVGL